MTRIATITFSPCIDKSAAVSALLPEKKLLCSELKYEPGGGGINVARAINKLGGEAAAIYPAGGYTGEFFTQLLEDEHVPSIVIDTVSHTRENIIILDKATNQQYRFGMPAGELSENEWVACLQEIEQLMDVEFIVASGSLPPSVPLDIFARIAKIAKKKNAKLIVDTSGEALKNAIINEGVYLLKPNLGELSSLVGKEELQLDMIDDAAKEIIAKGYCEVIVVSMGAAGAMLVTKDIMQTITTPPVKRKSTVGAGDSMVAGIVLSLSKGKNLLQSVQYGVACGTAATMNPGTELCRFEDVEKLFMQIQRTRTVI
ncbi:1-phosphofructokinase family hexose kinase [Solitalea lacus]|uniref:1-phosphofructokinase family hexose kinase n=1 Tax=Solitalea lacus TaxID=2911172 RepID=UPI001ED9E344|nr:hexose kinase [Solitalea lacus]UKJ06733.1 hexose kinase [Solitalea lacus]